MFKISVSFKSFHKHHLNILRINTKRHFSLNMKPILYYDDRSPPVRSVLMLIDFLKIDCDLKFVDLFKGEQFTDEFKQINPSHTVPTLKHDDVILNDSHTILMYLCEKYDNSCKLFPKDFNQRLSIIDKLFFECSVLFRRDSDLMSEIIRKGFKNVDFNSHETKILEAYSILDSILAKQNYVALNTFTIADFSIVATLSTVNILLPVTEDKWPHLNKWFNQIKLMEAYAKFNNDGLIKLKDALERFGDFKIELK